MRYRTRLWARKRWLAMVAIAVLLPGLSLVATRVEADTPVPTPPGMLPPGTYSLTVASAGEAEQSPAPTLTITNNGIYLQDFNIPPDDLQLALSTDPYVPNQVDLNSIYLDGVTFEAECSSGPTCSSNLMYRPANVQGITAPFTWGSGNYDSDASDPSNPQSGILGVSYTAYPPVENFLTNGTSIEIQEIDMTFTFDPGYSIGGMVTQTHYQVVGDPTRTADFLDGNITSTLGLSPIGDAVFLGSPFLDGWGAS